MYIFYSSYLSATTQSHASKARRPVQPISPQHVPHTSKHPNAMLLKRTCTAAPREVVRNLKILLCRPQEPKTTGLGHRAWSAINTVCFGTHKIGRQRISSASSVRQLHAPCHRITPPPRFRDGGRRVMNSRERASEPDKSRTRCLEVVVRLRRFGWAPAEVSSLYLGTLILNRISVWARLDNDRCCPPIQVGLRSSLTSILPCQSQWGYHKS